MFLTNRFEEDPDYSIIVNKEVVGYTFNFTVDSGFIFRNPFCEDQFFQIVSVDKENRVIHAKLG